MRNQWNDKIFEIDETGFERLALETFHFQYRYNHIYKAYVDMLAIHPGEVTTLVQIPFLPIQFFKTHTVKTTEFEPQVVFESSGTTGSVRSCHCIKDIELYKRSFVKAFESVYGSVSEWCIIGLLPSYLERENSSLIFMVDNLIKKTGHPQSGFYLDQDEKLYKTLNALEEAKQKTILIGVSFALLDFAEKYSLPLKQTVILETGGMKGRRKEMVRQELHCILQDRFKTDMIHSEYGMTELLSQAYSKGRGIFYCPPWMNLLIRDEEDPFRVINRESLAKADLLSTNDQPVKSERGIINIIDLANLYSCSFIATDDAGLLYQDGGFEVIGRIDSSDVRGCSLMAM